MASEFSPYLAEGMVTRYNTNLASEFFVLSSLHRVGADAFLTLGNKKSVDIVVSRGSRMFTLDVKGVAGRFDWPADNIAETPRRRHFIVLVSYNGKIESPEEPPSVWVIPHASLAPFTTQFKVRRNISRAKVNADGKRFENAWWRIAGRSAT